LFDALGRFALGQARVASSTVVLVASPAAFAITGSAIALKTSQPSNAGAYGLAGTSVTFQVDEAAAPAGYSLTGVAASFNIPEAAATGSSAVTGGAASFIEGEVAQAGAYALSVSAPLRSVVGLTPAIGSYGVVDAIETFVQAPAGLDALGRLAIGQMSNAAPIFGLAVAINMPSAGSSYAVTPGPLNTLIRTGADFNLVYGGVGHYLEEIERARQFANITRKTPAPIVQPQRPPLHLSAGAPVAPQPPAVDPPAIAAQRMAQLQAQAEQARILRRRRQQAEILLLAS
jgi:hypothetical protein